MRACSAAQCGGEECCGALISRGGTPLWRWRRLPALPCLRPNDTAGAGRDATSPTSIAIRFACQTAKTLPVDTARSEILEFRRRKQQQRADRLLATGSVFYGVRSIDQKRPAAGERSSLSDTFHTSSVAPGWMKPQPGASSPVNTERFLQTGLLVPSTGETPDWLPTPKSGDDPRVISTRASPKTKTMGMLDSEEDWFSFRPAPTKFRISHKGMWPVTREAATGVREDQWLSLRTAFFNTAPDGCITPAQAHTIVRRLFCTLPPQQLLGESLLPLLRYDTLRYVSRSDSFVGSQIFRHA